MKKKEPIRLLNDRYVGSTFPLQMYSQVIDSHFDVHWHEFYELCYILKGNGTNVINGLPVSLREGSLFLLTPADFHEIYSVGHVPMELYNIVFSEELLTGELRSLLFAGQTAYSVQFDKENDVSVVQEFRRIEAEMGVRTTGYPIVVKGSLERILVEMFRKSSAAPKERERDITQHAASIRRALIYMQHHFREELKLEDAAREAQMAPNYFSACFKKTAGISFQHYLQELRISFASSLLRASVLPVTEICFASGFQTLTHFERVFKQKHSKSPKAYRQSFEEALTQ
ncbi:helix-turn-helix domain-containing protein [Paenibacillus allorhizosphaerae]|uniref:HTH-type transcriptional activator RhaS n=1 Tax=Paenibacillus allorhizosphaerae TaxID=2849866 RepID=A0ABN7TM22_9BACL|nr:AraC family transcriptional regulator [Paenibacillus allorhizosphaerae]CAG7638728.1 HTH-type transcriptional activator RhaS [Paenibacillus allorhizosphaerae]